MTVDAGTRARIGAKFAAGMTNYTDLEREFPNIGRGTLHRITTESSGAENSRKDELLQEAKRRKRRLQDDDIGTELITYKDATFWIRRNTSDLTQLKEVFGEGRAPMYQPKSFPARAIFENAAFS